MTKHLTGITLQAMFLLSFASLMYGDPVNCSVSPSDPACAPTLVVNYDSGDGQIQDVAVGGSPVFTNGAWLQNFVPQSLGNFAWTGGQLVTNSDPFVGFSFGVINSSPGVMTFSYDFAIPYIAGPYGYVYSVFGDVLIDTNGHGTSTVAPVGASYIMNTYDTGHLLGQVGLGKGCTTPVNAYVCVGLDDGAIGPLPYESFDSGTLEVKGSFALTPGGQYTLTGRSSLLPAPEPDTLLMFGTGIIGFARILRRKINP